MPELGKATYVVEIDGRDFDRELNKKRKNVEKTNKEIRADNAKTAKSWDPMAKSIAGVNKELGKTQSKTQDLDRDTNRLSRGFMGLVRNVGHAGKKLAEAGDAISTFNRNAQFLRNNIALIKWPALFVGAGLAAQAITALSGAVVGLVGSMGPLTGLLVTYPALLGSVAQGMLSVKLAMSGVGDSFKNLGEQMGKPTKESRRLGRALEKFIPQLRQLQKTAQGGLFDGILAGAKRSAGNMGRLQTVVGRTSAVLGKLVARAGSMFGSKGFGKDFQRIGTGNAKLMFRLGDAGLHFFSALRHIMVAAQPFLGWLGRGVQNMAKLADANLKTARSTGKLTGFFRGVRQQMELMWPFLRDTAASLFNIGRAAKPLGDDILKSLGKAAKGWREWTSSTKGRADMAAYFMDLKPTIFELGRLVSDIVKLFVKLGRNQDIAKLIHQVRTQLLPIFGSVVEQTTSAFGPTMIGFITNVLRLIGSLSGANGPLVLYVKFLSAAAGLLADLLQNNPALQQMAFTWIGLVGVFKTLAFVKAITGVNTLTGAFRKLTPVAQTAATATAGATGGGVVAGGARRPSRLEHARQAHAAPTVAARGTKLDSSLRAQAAQRAGREYGTVFGATAGAAAAPGFRDKMTGRMRAMAPAFRAVGTGVLGFALMNGIVAGITTQGGVGQRINAALSGLTLGIIPPPRDIRDRLLGNMKQAMQGGDPQQIGWSGFLDNLTKGLDAEGKEMVSKMTALRQEIVSEFGPHAKININLDATTATRSFDQLRTGMARLRNNLAGDARGISQNMRTNMQLISQLMGTESRAGRQAIVENMRAASQAINRSMKSGETSADRGMTQIRRAFVINSRASKETTTANMKAAEAAIRRAVGDGVISSRRGLAEMRKLWAAELRVYGLSPSQATNIVKGNGKGGRFGDSDNNLGREGGAFQRAPERAVGGYIGNIGERGRDVVPAMLGRGEAVLNRHQQGVVNGALMAQGVRGLPELFRKVDRPHSAGAMMSSPVHFATGGIVEAGNALRSMGYAVGEHPAFGGVRGGHTPNSFHYRGMAIDVNADNFPGGEGPALDRAASFLRGNYGGQILELLWRVADHFDHLHVAIGGAGTGALGRALTGGVDLPRLLAEGPDTPRKAAVQAILDTSHAAASENLSQVLGSMGGGDMMPFTGAAPGGAGGKYGKEELKALWMQAGGASAFSNIAAAVALAESSGNPNASNKNTNGSIDRGLWQINSIHGGLSTFDPLGNARSAVQISGGGINWNPWVAYQKGAHRQFLGRGGVAGLMMQSGGYVPGFGQEIEAGRIGPGRTRHDALRPRTKKQRQRQRARERAKSRKPKSRLPFAALKTWEGLEKSVTDKERDFSFMSEYFGATTLRGDQRVFGAEEYLVNPDPNNPDSQEVVNRSGMEVGGKWVGGIDAAVTELNHLIGLQVGIRDEKAKMRDTAHTIISGIQAAIREREGLLKRLREKALDNARRARKIRKRLKEINETQAADLRARRRGKKGMSKARRRALQREEGRLRGDLTRIGQDQAALTSVEDPPIQRIMSWTEGGAIGDTRTQLQEYQGKLPEWLDEPGRLNDEVRRVDLIEIPSLQAQIADATGTAPPAVSPAGGSGTSGVESESASLLREMLGDEQRNKNVLAAQYGPLQDFVKSHFVGAFETGTPFVPRTGMALIHKGEAVIPADANPFITGGAGLSGPLNIEVYLDGDLSQFTGKVRAVIRDDKNNIARDVNAVLGRTASLRTQLPG